jgi:hypothetical protein
MSKVQKKYHDRMLAVWFDFPPMLVAATAMTAWAIGRLFRRFASTASAVTQGPTGGSSGNTVVSIGQFNILAGGCRSGAVWLSTCNCR